MSLTDGSGMAKMIPRRQAIPILYTRGTHYDVGFDMGHTFGALIKDFLQLASELNKCYLPLYNTDEGKRVYNETLESVKKSFPQYIRELEGIADGANVEFHKLFLLHMDDILPQSLKTEGSSRRKEPVGCSTIVLNGQKHRIMAHNEDALAETLNNFYYVVAHIISDSPQGKYKVKEERFMSLCYAGHLPGYTMSYNEHGMVCCINTLGAKYLRSGHTPRHFISRALLTAQNLDQAVKIIKDKGVGSGDGCSINLAFINSPSETCYNIETAPPVGNETETRMDIKEIPLGSFCCHANKYEHMDVPATDDEIAQSVARMNTFSSYKDPSRKQDVLQMLGDCSGEYCVFRDNGKNEKLKTIATGVFDLNAKTFAIYSDNPSLTEAHVTIPLVLKELGCGCMSMNK